MCRQLDRAAHAAPSPRGGDADPAGAPDDQLIAAYRATRYGVAADPPFELHVGRWSAELDALLLKQGTDCAAYITAWNPFSVPAPEAGNRAAQARLERQLRDEGYAPLTGVGRDPRGRWPGEPSVLVPGLSRDAAIAIGRMYRQHAVLWVRRGAAVELVLIE
jgi:hypothetical protein